MIPGKAITPVVLVWSINGIIPERRLRVTRPRTAWPEVAPSALGALAALSCALAWLVNPYLALFAAPAAHVWVLASSDRLRGPLPVSAGAALACVLPVAALLAVAEALGLGIDAPWTFTLMVADGQIGLLTMVAAAFLAGTLIALVALAFRRRGSRSPADAQESSTDV